jgi:hypothetical protein
MATYEFSTNDGVIKGKVYAYTRQEAANKAFTALSHRLKNRPDYEGDTNEIILRQLTFDDPLPQAPIISNDDIEIDFID